MYKAVLRQRLHSFIVNAGARVANLYCFAYSPPGPIRLSGKDANLYELVLIYLNSVSQQYIPTHQAAVPRRHGKVGSAWYKIFFW